MNPKAQKQAQAAAATLAALAVNGAVLHTAANLSNESWHPQPQAQVQKNDDET
jgi:hypothetical protein